MLSTRGASRAALVKIEPIDRPLIAASAAPEPPANYPCTCPECGYRLVTKDTVFGDWTYRAEGNILMYRGEVIDLQRSKAAICGALIEAKGKVVSRQSLLGSLSTYYRTDDEEPGIHILDVHICRTRLKIAETVHRKPLQTMRGRGFHWVPEA